MFSPCDLCRGVSLSARVYLRTREQFFSSPFAHRSFTNGSVWPAFSGYIKYNLPFIIGSFLFFRIDRSELNGAVKRMGFTGYESK